MICEDEAPTEDVVLDGGAPPPDIRIVYASTFLFLHEFIRVLRPKGHEDWQTGVPDLWRGPTISGLDIETEGGFNPHTLKIATVQIELNETVYVVHWAKHLDVDDIEGADLFRFYLESYDVMKVIHNASFELKFFLKAFGMDLHVNNVHDSMAGEYILAEGSGFDGDRIKTPRGTFRLDSIVLRRYGYIMDKDKALVTGFRRRGTVAVLPPKRPGGVPACELCSRPPTGILGTGKGAHFLCDECACAPQFKRLKKWEAIDLADYASTTFTTHDLTSRQLQYAAFDAYFCAKIARDQLATMSIQDTTMGYNNLYLIRLDSQTAEAAARMELHGMPINEQELWLLDAQWESELEFLTEDIREMLWQDGDESTPLNINADKQMITRLNACVDFQARSIVLTNYQGPELKRLRGIPVVDKILEYKMMMKLRSYTKGFIERLNTETKRVHCNFNYTECTTGRLCVAKGTLIEVVRDVSLAPKGIPVEDVRAGDLAYTFDDNKRLTLKPVVWAGKTGHKSVVRVHWTGTGQKHTGYIDLTPEHPVRLISGEYRKAVDLQPNDRVLALSRGDTSYGYSRLWATGHEPIAFEHRFIFQTMYGYLPEHVHHDNHNKLDNRLENLVPKTPEELAAKRALALKNFAPHYGKHAKSGAENPRWLGLSKQWIEDVFWETGGKPTVFRDVYGIDYATIQKYMRLHGIDWKAIRKNFNDSGQRLDRDLIESAREAHERFGQKVGQQVVGLGYYPWRQLQEENGYVPYNHIVNRIEVLQDAVDVYDLEIKDTHNFIANELCVHNSSSDPNLQNLPSRSKLGRRVRSLVQADEGWVFVIADYSQIELRLIAEMFNDVDMIQTFIDDRDVHTMMAAKMVSAREGRLVTYEEVEAGKETIYKDDRTNAKPANFGLGYGAGLAKFIDIGWKGYELPWTHEEAKTIRTTWQKTWPGVVAFHKTTGEKIKNGSGPYTVWTQRGRRRRMPREWMMDVPISAAKKKELLAAGEPVPQMKKTCYSAAMNHPIQGSSADMVKEVMVSLMRKVQIVLQIHDELVLTCRKEDAPEVLALLKGTMETFGQMYLTKLPIKVDAKIATSWAK